MARKRSSSNGLLIIVAVVIAILAYIPKEVWYAAITIAIVIVVVKVLTRKGGVATNTELSLRSPNPSRPSKHSVGDTAVRTRAPFLQEAFTLDRVISRPPTGEIAYKVRWVPAGERIQLAGFDIPGGMLYVGLSLKARSGLQDPALVNPSLRVFGNPVSVAERRMPYWPSYSEVSPEARRAYLQWLAGSRQDPAADVGYVFLFFYGLERRALIDLQGQPANDEVNVIAGEVRRLLQIYGNSGSFRSYATNFLGYLSAGSVGPGASEAAGPPDEPRGFDLPLSYRVGLGRFAANHKPLPTQWAIKWALTDPMISCRTPVQRCQAEFARMFAKYYAEEFGDGIVLPVNKTKLRVTYRPASGGFAGQVFTRDIEDLPDVGAITAPQKKLQRIVDVCAEALDRYSRFLGRHPGRDASLDAFLLLPPAAWPVSAQAAVEKLKSDTAAGETILSWKELLSRLGELQTVTRVAAVQLATKLEEFGIGIEPDIVAGSRLPDNDDKVVLFSTAARSKKEFVNADYTVASLTVELGSIAANADSEVCEPEIQQLQQVVSRWSNLHEAARQRLRAQIRLHIAQPPSLSSLRRKLELLSADSRRLIADILVNIVRADGVISPAEVKFLESAYKVLQLDAKLVYSDLHNGRTSTVPSQATRPRGAAIALDPARIARLHKETEQISAVLKDVFTDDAVVEPIAEEQPSDGESESSILGLKPEYANFTRLLLSRPQWSRAELTDAAADMELMLDGALERINEAAIEKFEAPLTEGDDPVDVNRAVLEKVFA